MKWKEIDSAPKDGSVILGFHVIHEVPVTIYYTGTLWRERTLTTEWPDNAFSYWMKLPKRPKITKQKWIMGDK